MRLGDADDGYILRGIDQSIVECWTRFTDRTSPCHCLAAVDLNRGLGALCISLEFAKTPI
jgi:hypothetical protein